ncbi:MAG: MgtC/SapB family protein [Planctomycetes bacterium]|nr:MgtC/SapB family protein [Planctomycetota bacterium]
MWIEHWPAWIGNVHDAFPAPVCGVIVTLAATFCGALVGLERAQRQKPAGLRTMMLICLGACIFTQVGVLLADENTDPGRIAAQVVTGVGFLGAGAILHGRGAIIGITTAAAIWVVAAVGVTLGAGYIVAGLFFTLLTFMTLRMEERIEAVLCGKCRWSEILVRFEATNGRTRWRIQHVLDEHQLSDDCTRFESDGENKGVVRVRFCHFHRQHRAVVAALAGTPGVECVEMIGEREQSLRT